MKRNDVSKSFHQMRRFEEQSWEPELGGSWVDSIAFRGTGADVASLRHFARVERRWMVNQGGIGERYQLSRTPSLFRTFADLEPGEMGFLAFAHRYGFLTKNVFACVDSANPNHFLAGEPYAFWRHEHEDMSAAVRLHRLLLRKSHSQPHLSELAAIGFQLEARRGWMTPEKKASSLEFLKRLWDSYGREEVLAWGWHTLILTFNFRLAPEEASTMGALCYLDDDFDRSNGWGQHAVRIKFSTDHLITGMWIQFAQTVEGNLEHRRCASRHCDNYFLVSPLQSGKRKQAKYCSNSCRLQEWRSDRPKRRKTTLKQHQERR